MKTFGRILAVALLMAYGFGLGYLSHCPIKPVARDSTAYFQGCQRCKTNNEPGHYTCFMNSMGDQYPCNWGGGGGLSVSPLCEVCWIGLGSGQARWPYYERLVKLWYATPNMPDDFTVLHSNRLYIAVMDGK